MVVVVLKEKLSEYPTEVIGQTTPGDDKAQITDDIMEFINQGADMVVCSGGMSVDPDDRTPGGIRDTSLLYLPPLTGSQAADRISYRNTVLSCRYTASSHTSIENLLLDRASFYILLSKNLSYLLKYKQSSLHTVLP